MLREMELKSYLKESRENRISMEVRKGELASFRQLNSHELENDEQTRQKERLMREYDLHSRRRAMSVSLPQTEQPSKGVKEGTQLKEQVNSSAIV